MFDESARFTPQGQTGTLRNRPRSALVNPVTSPGLIQPRLNFPLEPESTPGFKILTILPN